MLTKLQDFIGRVLVALGARISSAGSSLRTGGPGEER